MNILFKYTSRSRPENFERGLLSIIDNASHLSKLSVLVSLDRNDTTIQDYRDKITPHFGKTFMKVVEGESTGKINAINRDLNEYKGGWDLLINMSDDMVFLEKGFDDQIRSIFNSHFPLGDGFLHLNDGRQRDNISTMSIMDRKYYERDRYIYNREYKSLWCDVEATEVAWMRGCYAYAPIILFDHLHPAWGLAPTDAQYQASEARELWDHDKAVIKRHRAINYGIEAPIKRFKYPTL